MSFVSRCPYCNNAYQAEESGIGQVMSCVNCRKQFIIQRDEDNVSPEPETKFTSRCPYCNNACQAEKSEIGQIMNCPTCGKQFVLQVDEDNAAPQPMIDPKFTSRCPYCGGSYESEDSAIGQVMNCPVCGKPIVIQRDESNAAAAAPQSNVETKFISWCPYCGEDHVLDKQMLDKVISCSRCQKAFVAQKETTTTSNPVGGGAVCGDASLRQKLQSAYQTYFGFSIIFLAATACYIYFTFGDMFGGDQHIVSKSGTDSMISVYFSALVFSLMLQGLNSIVLPHCWEQIKSHRQTPVNAITFLFIPILNCYWNFAAIVEMGKFLSGVTGNQTPQKLAKAYSIVFIIFCLYPFPLLYPVLPVLGMFMISSFCNAIKRWQNWA